MSHSAALVPPGLPVPDLRPILLVALHWLRRRWRIVLLTSAAVLIPCFWHRHIQACDLGSHVYNAWLSQTVAQGLLPGLHLERQYTNVVFDLLLSRLFPFLGPVGAERVAVSVCVLVFFWGAFAFASAAARRPAWIALPLLAIITYGAIFHLGFFNFYLSAGFSFFGLAIAMRGRRLDWLVFPVFLALSALCHPMGAACLGVLAFFLLLIRGTTPRHQLSLLITCLVGGILVRTYLVHQFTVLPSEIHAYWLLGADEIVVFGFRYLWIGIALLLFSAACVMNHLQRYPVSTLFPQLPVYGLVAVLVLIAPGGLFSDTSFGMMGYLPDRGSIYSAVALVAVVASCRPQRWFVVGTSLAALIFFIALRHDTGVLDKRESKVADVVSVHKGRRILSLLPPLPGRIHEDHTLEYACIGHCYAYSNYEPSSMQFRLRAEPGNRIVEVNQDALDAMQDGSYVVQERDLPLFEVYQCGPKFIDVCITELHAGQENGDVPGLSPRP